MKSMDEYTAELDRIIEKKKAKQRARRKAIVGVCSGLAACALIFGVWKAVSKPKSGSVTPVEGVTAELPIDGDDRFIAGNGRYSVENAAFNESDRMEYTGLIAFERGGGVLFTESELGPLYTAEENGVGHIIGRAPTGAFFGAAYYDGGIYMPATSEVVCGLVRKNGVCRYDLETRETTPVILSDETVSSVLIVGDKLIYAANGQNGAAVKLCDLSSGRVYRLAKFKAEVPEDGWPEDAKLCLCEGGAAVRYCGKVSTVSFSGEVRTIAENAEEMSAQGGRVFVFCGLEFEGYNEYGERPFPHGRPSKVRVYSAGTGELLSETELGEYVPACDAFGFTVHDERLVAAKNGHTYLLDPVSNEAKELCGVPECAIAADLGEKLLLLDRRGSNEQGERIGTAYVIGEDGEVYSGELPTGLSSVRDEEIVFASAEEAEDELLYERFDMPLLLDKLENVRILGWGSTHISYAYGERHEKSMEYFRIEAEYKGKKLTANVRQEPKNLTPLDFASKLGLGGVMVERLLEADETPVFQESAEGTLYFDLLRENGEPIGIMRWFEDAEGKTVDIEARLLRESKEYVTVITLTSEELCAEEIREIIKQ